MKRLAIAMTLMLAGVAGAQDSIGSLGDYYDGETTIARDSLLDSLYDFEVYSAVDVAGETEFLILARFPNGDWDFVHAYDWLGSPDRGMTKVDLGVRSFNSRWSAERTAADLKEDGEILEFSVIESEKQPDWVLEGTFPTRATAEEHADEIEYWSAEFGQPRITKVVAVQKSIRFRSFAR